MGRMGSPPAPTRPKLWCCISGAPNSKGSDPNGCYAQVPGKKYCCCYCCCPAPIVAMGGMFSLSSFCLLLCDCTTHLGAVQHCAQTRHLSVLSGFGHLAQILLAVGWRGATSPPLVAAHPPPACAAGPPLLPPLPAAPPLRLTSPCSC